jgi:hypothetical protein
MLRSLPTTYAPFPSLLHTHFVAHHEIVELVRYTLGFYASMPVGLADVGISSNVRFAPEAAVHLKAASRIMASASAEVISRAEEVIQRIAEIYRLRISAIRTGSRTTSIASDVEGILP